MARVTPDSFSDGGRWPTPAEAVAHGLRLVAQGADLVDVGGESTRPGTGRVSAATELGRVVDVVRELVDHGVEVSVDTMRAEVADACVRAGAAWVNDVSGGLADPDMLPVVAASGVGYVAMHWRGHSATMQQRASYDDVVAAAVALARRLAEALAASGLGRGVAAISAGVVARYGLAGPVGRASGVRADLRVDAPDLAYPALAELLRPPDAPTTGDAHARFAHLAAEVVQSGALVLSCLDELPPGDLTVRLPNVVRLPEGDAHLAIEAPLGRAGLFVVSRGDKTPWRLSLRTPSLANVSAWPAVLPGTPVGDLALAVASLPYVTGDLDK